MKESEIYWYEDRRIGELIIGKRGGSEFKMSLDEFNMLLLRRRLDHKMTPELAYKIVLENSQYVDFEDVVEVKGYIGG